MQLSARDDGTDIDSTDIDTRASSCARARPRVRTHACANDWDDLAQAYKLMGRDKLLAWEKSCPTLKNWKSADFGEIQTATS